MRIVGLIIFTLAVAVGCGSFTTLTESSKRILADHRRPDNHMRRKVGVAVFGHRAFPMDYSTEESIQKSIADGMMSECPDTILVTPTETAYSAILVSLPRHASGRINSFRLAQLSRQLGVNAVVTGASVDIHEEIEETGILWFRGTRHYARLNVSVDVYDTSTAAKLLGENYVRRIEVDAAGLDRIRARDYGAIGDLPAVLLDVADHAAAEICEAVRLQPWKAYVISVEGGRASLSSGRAAGLKVGDVLDVYNSQDTLEGIDDQRFYLPGPKVAEIRVTAVSSHQAQAAQISGESIAEGSLVLMK